MAYVLETGAGLPNSTSYVSVEYADAYFDGISTDWNGDTAQKQSALNRATKAIDVLYSHQFQSSPTFPQVQALAFPRESFYAGYREIGDGEIPTQLKDAVCEVALQIIKAPDTWTLPDANLAAASKASKIKIDVLEFNTDYSSVSTNETLTGFYSVELLIAPLLENRGKPKGLRSMTMYL